MARKVFMVYNAPFGTLEKALAYYKEQYPKKDYGDNIYEFNVNDPKIQHVYYVDSYTFTVNQMS